MRIEWRFSIRNPKNNNICNLKHNVAISERIRYSFNAISYRSAGIKQWFQGNKNRYSLVIVISSSERKKMNGKSIGFLVWFHHLNMESFKFQQLTFFLNAFDKYIVNIILGFCLVLKCCFICLVILIETQTDI